jgi:hypothetical protein
MIVSDYDALVQRIVDYYSRCRPHGGATGSFWTEDYDGFKSDVKAALDARNINALRSFLQNPDQSLLFYGFEQITRASPGTGDEATYQHMVRDSLKRLAEWTGAVRIHNPESGRSAAIHTDEELLSAIEARIGIQLAFPNPFTRNRGIPTSRGIVGYRALQGLYMAWRVKTLLRIFGGSRVLEIGGGLGWAAFYSRKLGVGDYTILDLPMTGISQAYFLGSLLGPDAVRLHDEKAVSNAISIVPPDALSGKYDLIVAQDCLTEFNETDATRYVEYAAKHSKVFVTINHEANPHTAQDYFDQFGLVPLRQPYGLRAGYVEELIVND